MNPLRKILESTEWIYVYTNRFGVQVWDHIVTDAGAQQLQVIFDLPSPSGIEGDVYR